MIPGRAALLRSAAVRHRRRRRLRARRAHRPWRRTRRRACAALPDQCRPAPSSLAVPRRTPAATRRWPVGRVALIGARHFEQRHVADAPVGIALRSRSKARQQRGPHVATCRRRSDWRASAPAAPPPNSSACSSGMNDQVTASSMPRTASARLAVRVRICSVVRILPLTAPWLSERLRRDVVDAVDAHDLLDQVGLAVDVRPPGRHGRPSTISPVPCDVEAEARRGSSTLSALGTSRPVSRFTSEQREVDPIFGSWPLIADDLGFGGVAAAEFEHQFGRQLEARHHEVRIDAALEAVARIGDDAEVAAGAGDVERLPQRRIRSARRWCSRRSRNARRP